MTNPESLIKRADEWESLKSKIIDWEHAAAATALILDMRAALKAKGEHLNDTNALSIKAMDIMKRLDVAKKALRFYANKDNYNAENAPVNGVSEYGGENLDDGDIARQALIDMGVKECGS